MLMKIQSFTVLPNTPEKLNPLKELAMNLWYSWNWGALQVFKKIDQECWHECGKNPLRMLCEISQEKLIEASENDDYIDELDTVYAEFKRYLAGKNWYEGEFGEEHKKSIAYFSMEYALHESLPIYSGGLGVLAGDHLKSASDLGVPLVAIGFLYRQGYFRQGLDAEGMQQEFYPENNWFNMPVKLQKKDNGDPIKLNINLNGEQVYYQIWKVDVGRIPLYLLDTNLPENIPKNQDITKRLYDADRDMRLRQEILIGIGGVRALKELGHFPSTYHINEGHSAFLILERLKELIKDKHLTFEEAKEIVWATNIFTTHTPVPAGNEHFDPDLMKKYLEKFVTHNLKITWQQFLKLGHYKQGEANQKFCLTILALNFSGYCNGVSKLHGKVSRNMWQELYPKMICNEIPIRHITNGVHSMSWLSKSLERLLVRTMETSYVKEIADFTIWKIVDQVSNQALWDTHNERKNALINYVRRKMTLQLRRRGANASEINKVKDILSPDILTIGFARRFAPYKRGSLLFKDVERLRKIITNQERPVQFIFAGKAHPADEAGKAIIKEIFDTSSHLELKNNIVFLEDYDLDMARYLVQGVDVWLNTPRRPLEASGTSGMKAAINGGLNLSILDGWWDEAFNESNGWAIGHGETYDNHEHQDTVESKLLYRLIENEVSPLYYDRNEKNLPLGWIEMMKNSIKNCGEQFNAHRMVCDYINKYYIKAKKLSVILLKDDCQETKRLAKLHKKLHKNWHDIEIISISSPPKDVINSGKEVSITAKIKLNKILPEEIIVEAFHGPLQLNDHKIIDPQTSVMRPVETNEDLTIFQCDLPCTRGGHYGYTIRILPNNKNLAVNFIPGLIKWNE